MLTAIPESEPVADLGGEGAEGGGGGGERRFLQDSTLADSKGLPFVLFIFGRQSILILREGTRAKKTRLLVKIFQKVPKNAVFELFLFSKIWLRRKKFGQIRVFKLAGESSENQFGRPKNKVDKIFNFFFWKFALPPRETTRSAPDPNGLVNEWTDTFLLTNRQRKVYGAVIT